MVTEGLEEDQGALEGDLGDASVTIEDVTDNPAAQEDLEVSDQPDAVEPPNLQVSCLAGCIFFPSTDPQLLSFRF